MQVCGGVIGGFAFGGVLSFFGERKYPKERRQKPRFLARFWVLFPRGKSDPPEAEQADSITNPPKKRADVGISPYSAEAGAFFK